MVGEEVPSLESIHSIVADHLGNNLYWVDALQGTVEVYSMVTKHRAIVHHYMGRSKPLALVCLPARGELVIALQNYYGKTTFVRMSMDGRGDYAHVLQSNIGVDGIQLLHDEDSEQIYWLDRELQQIMFTDYDCEYIQIILTFIFNCMVSFPPLSCDESHVCQPSRSSDYAGRAG